MLKIVKDRDRIVSYLIQMAPAYYHFLPQLCEDQCVIKGFINIYTKYAHRRSQIKTRTCLISLYLGSNFLAKSMVS